MNKREYLTTQELIERINLYNYRIENSQTEESFNINTYILSSLQQEYIRRRTKETYEEYQSIWREWSKQTV